MKDLAVGFVILAGCWAVIALLLAVLPLLGTR